MHGSEQINRAHRATNTTSARMRQAIDCNRPFNSTRARHLARALPSKKFLGRGPPSTARAPGPNNGGPGRRRPVILGHKSCVRGQTLRAHACHLQSQLGSKSQDSRQCWHALMHRSCKLPLNSLTDPCLELTSKGCRTNLRCAVILVNRLALP